ncbi:glycosyltransferase [Paenibacillus enshidis]|uniref:Glycosyltransferase n=1 Tax=Paenibacillus enshidis TaxID=1458439 RepID=A0ABV5ASM3_9BACL
MEEQQPVNVNSLAAAVSYNRGRESGMHAGYEEGYFRGRANAIAARRGRAFPVRPLHILYVSSGKLYPYSPIDQAIIATLQDMVRQVTIADPRQQLADIAAQVKPDLVLALDGMEIPLHQVDDIRNKGIRTAVWLTDDPYYTDTTSQMAPHFDDIFTLEINCIDLYRQLGCSSVHYLPFAAYRGHYFPLTVPSVVRRDVNFTGSAYWSRVYFMNPIMPQLMSYNTGINGLWWDRIENYHQYASKIDVNKWHGPEDTNQLYNGSKIVINLHRSHLDESVNNNTILKIPAASPNPRCFEICAASAFQLTDARDNMASFYKPGEEIETYSTPQELIEKIEYYLTHDKERQEIALRGLERTLKEHTYAHRLHQMLSILFP